MDDGVLHKLVLGLVVYFLRRLEKLLPGLSMDCVCLLDFVLLIGEDVLKKLDDFLLLLSLALLGLQHLLQLISFLLQVIQRLNEEVAYVSLGQLLALED